MKVVQVSLLAPCRLRELIHNLFQLAGSQEQEAHGYLRQQLWVPRALSDYRFVLRPDYAAGCH